MYPANPLGTSGYNPYLTQLPLNPVIPNYQPVQSQGPRMQIEQVNGKESAYAYNIGPNSSTLLADATQAKIWMITTDSSGYKMVKGFKIEPDDDESNSVTATVEDSELKQQMTELTERLDQLEKKVSYYGESDSKFVNSSESNDEPVRSNDWNSKNGKGSNGRH